MNKLITRLTTAVVLAGLATWLVWPDAQGALSPFAIKRAGEDSYIAGIEARLTDNTALRLYQSSGTRTERLTGLEVRFQW